MSDLGVAVVGCGYWGVNYIRLASNLPNVHLVGICDQDPERVEQVAQRFPNVAHYTDLEYLLESDELDAVIVSVTAAQHYTVARRVLESGKHVLLEKPMTINSADAQDLIDLATKNNLKLMVGHIFLFNAGLRYMKNYIRERNIEPIHYMYSRRTNLGPFRKDVNALWDLATHDVSIFNYLLDSVPERVNAIGGKFLNNGLDDAGFVTLHYPNGIVGHIHISWIDPNKEREIVLVSGQNRIVFNDLDPQEKVRIFEKGVASSKIETNGYGEFQLSVRDGDIISPHLQLSEPLKDQVLHFFDCIINDNQPLTDGKNGLDVVRIMEAIDYSIRNEGLPVNLAEFTPVM